MRAWMTALLVGPLACSGPGGHLAAGKPGASSSNGRLQNLRRAAQYPWLDDGTCAVREADGEWRTVVEQCYHALDLSRMKFRDVNHRCLVAQADAATVQAAVGLCLLVQPELVVGAIVVIGVVVVASAIAAEIAKAEALERARAPASTKPCLCTCLGRANPAWNPGDRDHGDRNGGMQPHPAECRAVCTFRGFSSSQCQ